MKITFGIDFDQGSWPGPLAGRDAVAGEAWVGPGGLLGLLETALGLGGPREAEILRVARLVPAVQSIEGFWSKTAEHNPLAAARTLLDWRDELWMCGWRGEPLRPRLQQLAEVTASASPGFPDRLNAVTEALSTRGTDIAELVLCDPQDDLAPLWQKTLALLAIQGTRISERSEDPAAAKGDLLAVRSDGFKPKVDGTLQLLRPYGQLAAAEEVAAWLTTLKDLDGSVVIGGDSVLDAALSRHGLPTLGLASTHPGGEVLELLPLVLEMGWDPPDPQRAMELLSLSESPIPRGIASRLIEALAEWPAVGSDLWNTSVDKGLASLDDESYRAAVAERIKIIFTGAISRQSAYPSSEIRSRVELLRDWFGGKLGAGDGSGDWGRGVEQCTLLLSILAESELSELPGAQLERFVQAATASVSLPEPFGSQAGIVSVGRPGSITGEAKRIIWWSFNSASAPVVRRIPASAETRQALADADVTLPDPGQQALALATRWRRPLNQASNTLLLVCPGRSADGSDLYLHSLWDELVGRHKAETLSPLVLDKPLFPEKPKIKVHEAVEPPSSTRLWSAPAGLLPPREAESPSSLGSLLGCSLQWAFKYRARLYPGRSSQVAGEALVLGKLLHEIVEEVLLEHPASPKEAEDRAIELFEHKAPRLVATLFLPGADALLSQTRRNAGSSAKHLTSLLLKAGLEVKSTEQSLTAPAFGSKVNGRLDLIVGDPPAVIDLKLGGTTNRRKELEQGTAHALAVYSHMLGADSKDYPPVGYYILVDQVLLATDGDRFPGAEIVPGISVQDSWQALKRAVAARQKDLKSGQLEAPGNADVDGEVRPQKTEIVDDRLVCQAPCKYCDYGYLCGLTYHEEPA